MYDLQPTMRLLKVLAPLLTTLLLDLAGETADHQLCSGPVEPPHPEDYRNRLTFMVPWIDDINPVGRTVGAAMFVASERLAAMNCPSLKLDILPVACTNPHKVLKLVSWL